MSLDSTEVASWLIFPLNATWNTSPLLNPMYSLLPKTDEYMMDTDLYISCIFGMVITILLIYILYSLCIYYSSNIKKVHGLNHNVLIPWRLCVAGGWLDQPWVSQILQPLKETGDDIGSVIVMNVDYHSRFRERSGLATSSRNTAIKLWETGIFPQKLSNTEIARLLFGAENPPGTRHISGSQDHLGLLLPGINKLGYNGKYWPIKITSIQQAAKEENKNIHEIYNWLQSILWLVPFAARPNDFNPTAIKNLTVDNVRKLAMASEKVWNAILNMNAYKFGEGLTDTIKAYKLILPNTIPIEFEPIWRKYDRENYGCSFTGAGGGGFLLVIADKKPDQTAFQTKINTKSWWRKN